MQRKCYLTVTPKIVGARAVPQIESAGDQGLCRRWPSRPSPRSKCALRPGVSFLVSGSDGADDAHRSMLDRRLHAGQHKYWDSTATGRRCRPRQTASCEGQLDPRHRSR